MNTSSGKVRLVLASPCNTQVNLERPEETLNSSTLATQNDGANEITNVPQVQTPSEVQPQERKDEESESDEDSNAISDSETSNMVDDDKNRLEDSYTYVMDLSESEDERRNSKGDVVENTVENTKEENTVEEKTPSGPTPLDYYDGSFVAMLTYTTRLHIYRAPSPLCDEFVCKVAVSDDGENPTFREWRDEHATFALSENMLYKYVDTVVREAIDKVREDKEFEYSIEIGLYKKSAVDGELFPLRISNSETTIKEDKIRGAKKRMDRILKGYVELMCSIDEAEIGF